MIDLFIHSFIHLFILEPQMPLLLDMSLYSHLRVLLLRPVLLRLPLKVLLLLVRLLTGPLYIGVLEPLLDLLHVHQGE